MFLSDRFLSLIRAVTFYTILWVTFSVALVIASACITLLFLLLSWFAFKTMFLTVYLIVQAVFTTLYVYAIIESSINPKITEKGDDSNGN